MKPNEPHNWTVALYASPESFPRPAESVTNFAGDIQAVLNYADEQESEVDFEVHRFVITRRTRA